MAFAKNATDGEILRFAEKHALGPVHAQMIRFGLSEDGLRATTDRIFRVVKDHREHQRAARKAPPAS